MKKLTKGQIFGVIILLISITLALLTENDTLDTIFGFLSAVGLVLAIGGKLIKKQNLES